MEIDESGTWNTSPALQPIRTCRSSSLVSDVTADGNSFVFICPEMTKQVKIDSG
jgi:hypothetical protein